MSVIRLGTTQAYSDGWEAAFGGSKPKRKSTAAKGSSSAGRAKKKAGGKIEEAVIKVVSEKVKNLSAGKMGYYTQGVGDLVVEAM